jgi:1,4-alpha-glucan branching enzyme
MRKGKSEEDTLVICCNFSPVLITGYRIGIPAAGKWLEIFNSDAKVYSGSGAGNFGILESVPLSLQDYPQSLTLNLPPLAALFLKKL